jgi:hypothetical protein
MAVTGSTRIDTPDRPATAAKKAPPIHAQLVGLARRTPSRSLFFTEAFRAIARSFKSPYAAACVRLGSEVIEDDFHSGPTDPRFWKESLQKYLTESLASPGACAKLLHTRDGTGAGIAFLSSALYDGTATIGAIALVAACQTDTEVTSLLAVLESLTCLSGYLAESIGGPAGATSATADANESLARASGAATAEELAFNITNSLRTRLACEQVSLGVVVGRRIRVLSVSGLDNVAVRSPSVIRLRGAMEECLDANRIIACQHEDEGSEPGSPDGYCIHRQWQRIVGGDAVASIPLRVQERVVAVISLRRRADQPFAREKLEAIRAKAEPYATALVVLRNASRGLARHAVESAREGLRAMMAPSRIGRKLALAGTVTALAWILFGSASYSLKVPCRVAPARLRHISVPFDGTISSAAGLAGDRILQGDLLCQLDARDLQQQRAEVAAKIAVLEREKDRAMAAREPASFQLALANQELARAELAINDRRIEMAGVRSPIDGVIIAGDLRKLVGSTVARGTPLFQVAPLDDWIIEIDVPEADADDLNAGLEGSFSPNARPEESRDFHVTRVRPASETRGEKNVFIGEAKGDLPFDWMRPGMEGVARVRVGQRPVWWVMFHRVIDYLRLKLWL